MKGKSSAWRQLLALPRLAWRNTHRNRRRTIVLAFGLIISISVLTGIFTYIDTTNAALIQRSIEDLSVDISVNFANRSTQVEEVNKVVDYIENVVASDMILQADRICGGMPYDDWQKEGFVINEAISNESTNTPSREPTFVFGVDFSYFTLVQSVFSFLNVSGSVNSIDTGMAFISKPLAESKGWTIGQNLSIGMSKATTISLFGIPIRRSKIVKQVNVTVNDFMELDLKIFMDNLMAFIPELANSFFADILSMLPFIGVSFNVAFIKYETMMQMTENFTDSRAIHGIHIAIDHDNLGADINKVLTELAAFDTALTNNFPNLLITNFARETIENLQDQLTEYRLFIYYFSLPGLLLGLFVSLYVNELTLSERKRETLILRLRNAQYSQTNAITILEAVIISVIGAILGLSLGAVLGTLVSQEEAFSLRNSGLEDLLPEITLESFFTALFIALILTIILTFVFVRDLSSQEAVQAFHSEREITRPYWSRYGIDIILLIIVAFTVIFREFNINPVPTFAIDFYNLIVPLLLWIGLSLCLMRLLSWLIQRIEKPMLLTFPLVLGNSGKSIARYIVRSRHRLIQPILIIVLSLSFAATLANVTATFNEQSVKESQYSIGADIRVKLPSMNQLEFNTSDLRKDIESLDSVETVTETFVTLLPWGWGFALLVGIEPEQFYKVSFF
ncbi:MAG: FtsX-like permease family protein, partial [Promethearchaeota archaeon]